MNALKSIQKKAAIIYASGMTASLAWAAIGPQGEVFTLGGDLIGHQANPHVALNNNGGFVVWEHVSKLSNGSRILIQPLNGSLDQNGGPLRVSESTTRDDESDPRVAMLPNGGAVVVWAAGPRKERDVFVRFLDAGGSPMGGTMVANGFIRGNQDRPDVAVNSKGEVMVTWESQYQDGAGDGVYARRFTARGIKVGPELQMNQSIKWSQFNPVIDALTDGRFIVGWISEVEQGKQYAIAGSGTQARQVGVSFMRSRVMGRMVGADGDLIGNEFRMDGGQAICSNAELIAMKGGGFAVAWEELDEGGRGLGQEIFVRKFSAQAQPLSPRTLHNRYGGGDQLNPVLATTVTEVMVAWDTGSLTTSGMEVHARMLEGGAEFRVNKQVVNQQKTVAAAGNDRGQVLVVWADVISPTSILLKARRYTTASPAIDLAAGTDVTEGGQGPNKVILSAKKEKLSPGGQKMKEETEQAIGNVIVRHESEINEAVRTTQASAKAAENVVRETATTRQNTRAMGPAKAPPAGGGGTMARPVNAEVVTSNGGSRINTGKPQAAGSGGFGLHSGGGGSARMTTVHRPAIVQQTRKPGTMARPSGALATTGNANVGGGGVARGGSARPTAGSRPAVSYATTQAARSYATTQAARNALITTAYRYTGTRRQGTTRSVPGVRAMTTTYASKTWAGFNQGTRSRISGFTGNRGGYPSGSQYTGRPQTQRSLTGMRPAGTVNRNPRGVIGGPYRGHAVGGSADRFNTIRSNAQQNTANALQARNTPVPSTVTLNNGRLSLRHNSRPGTRYEVQMSNDKNQWTRVGRPHVGTGRPMSVPFQSNGQRFIRVVPRD